jgi:large subunit ribosomal protein L4e
MACPDIREKHGLTCRLPTSVLATSDITRIINSDEVQSVLRSKKSKQRRAGQKKNPLVNRMAMFRLNPYAKTVIRTEMLLSEKRRKAKEDAKNGKVAKKAAAPAKAKALLKKRKAASAARGKALLA